MNNIGSDSCRDGGSVMYKHPAIKLLSGTEEDELWVDYRISQYGRKTPYWYIGYPDKGRRLTKEEFDEWVPWVINKVEQEIEQKQYNLDKFKNGIL